MIEVKAKTGAEQLRILDEHDRELGILSFYPTDLNLSARIETGTKEIESILKEAKDKTQIMEEKDFLAEVPVIDARLKEQLNYIFDTKVSSLFGETNLLTPTADGFLIEGILNAILPVIKDCIQKAADQMEKKKDKYLGAYKK
ncbi:MAG: hypothetical protein PUA92_09525 [Clostridium sp.]|nr:hypothetical protein [Clostridium sp.]